MKVQTCIKYCIVVRKGNIPEKSVSFLCTINSKILL